MNWTNLILNHLIWLLLDYNDWTVSLKYPEKTFIVIWHHQLGVHHHF